MAIQNYKAFLDRFADELMEALREAENLEWHHAGDTAAGRHYNVLVSWLATINERRSWYDAVKG